MILCRFLPITLLSILAFPAFSNADQLQDAKNAFDKKDFEKAYELFQPLAEEGNVEAQTRLGAMYVNGQGVERDLNKGLSLIMKAAVQGYETARRIAFHMHLDLANLDDTGTIYNVGDLCLKDWNGEEGVDICLMWLEKAAKLGHIRSAEMLNKIYKKGQYGITRDKKKAAEWKDLAKGFKKGINGTWAGAIPGGMGDEPLYLTYKFKIKDNKLTGSIQGTKGKKKTIEDGKMDGNNLSFRITMKRDGMDVAHYYTGTFLGNALRLSYTTDMENGSGAGSPTTVVAQRSRSTSRYSGSLITRAQTTGPSNQQIENANAAGF
jgi:hypothetical protein